jgi:hypothetical protein
MAKRKRANKYPGGFVRVPKRIMESPAWRAMSPIARLVWIDTRGWLRNDDLNNGKLYRSCRKAAKAIGCSPNTAMVAFAENEHFGFMRKTAEGFLGGDGYGIAAHYRFTDLAYGTQPPTRDYEQWNGSPFVFPGRRRAPRNQNPVANLETPRRQLGDIHTLPKRGSVCRQPGDIDGQVRCRQLGDISRLPVPRAKQKQGSLTARAPARAGGVGSSPAPVAKPGGGA